MWKYKNKEIKSIEDVPEGAIGFCYKITNKTNKKEYIGKKLLFSTRKKNFTKKEIAEMQNKRLKKWKHVTKESDWLIYNSSCDELIADISKGDVIEKEILEFAFNKSYLTYLEIKLQFLNEVLEKENFYNKNINSMFFKGICNGIDK